MAAGRKARLSRWADIDVIALHRARAPFLAALLVFVWGDEFAHGMPRLSPSGDNIKNDAYGIQSPLSEVYIASHLSLNSRPLRFKKISRVLQFPDKLFDFRNRCRSNLLNKWRTILGWLHDTPLLPHRKSKPSPTR